MMGFCRDPLVRELRKRGYSFVFLPDARVAPLLLVGRKASVLFRFGNLVDCFDSCRSAPLVVEETAVAPIDVTETAKLDSSLGTNALTLLLGGNLGNIGECLKSARHFVLKIDGITRKSVDLGDLDEFLAEAWIKMDLPTLKRLIETDSLYVISAVLQTHSITLESKGERRFSSDLAISEVQTEGNPSLKLDVRQGSENTLHLASRSPVTFAVQATKLVYAEGKYLSLDPDLGRLQLMGADSKAPDEDRLVDELGGAMPIFNLSD